VITVLAGIKWSFAWGVRRHGHGIVCGRHPRMGCAGWWLRSVGASLDPCGRGTSHVPRTVLRLGPALAGGGCANLPFSISHAHPYAHDYPKKLPSHSYMSGRGRQGALRVLSTAVHPQQLGQCTTGPGRANTATAVLTCHRRPSGLLASREARERARLRHTFEPMAPPHQQASCGTRATN